jgi:hypothetical protein
MSGSSGSDSDSGSDSAPPATTASGRPARAATGRGDAMKRSVAYTPIPSRATGGARGTPAASAAAEAARRAEVAAAFRRLVDDKGFQHTVLRDPRPGPGHGAELGSVWTLAGLPGGVKRAVAEAILDKKLFDYLQARRRPRWAPAPAGGCGAFR